MSRYQLTRQPIAVVVCDVPAYKCQLLILLDVRSQLHFKLQLVVLMEYALQLSEPRLHGASRMFGRVLLVGYWERANSLRIALNQQMETCAFAWVFPT